MNVQAISHAGLSSPVSRSTLAIRAAVEIVTAKTAFKIETKNVKLFVNYRTEIYPPQSLRLPMANKTRMNFMSSEIIFFECEQIVTTNQIQLWLLQELRSYLYQNCFVCRRV